MSYSRYSDAAIRRKIKTLRKLDASNHSLMENLIYLGKAKIKELAGKVEYKTCKFLLKVFEFAEKVAAKGAEGTAAVKAKAKQIMQKLNQMKENAKKLGTAENVVLLGAIAIASNVISQYFV